MALVLAPTRELACQIYDEARKVVFSVSNSKSFCFILQRVSVMRILSVEVVPNF